MRRLEKANAEIKVFKDLGIEELKDLGIKNNSEMLRLYVGCKYWIKGKKIIR